MMPHLLIEYSANIRAQAQIPKLCKQLADCLIAQQEQGQSVFPIGGIRVRALAMEDYCIADGRPDAAFVHATLTIGAGRSLEVIQATGDALFQQITAHFADLEKTMGLALSLQIAQFSESGNWKQNNLHALYRQA
jgi:5-carboxymethyl-2-hydroxymuconate isomerase